MSRLITSTAVAALALAAGACSTPPGAHLTSANNPSLYSVHQPVVQRTDFVFDVATAPGGVPGAELARLNAWFSSIQLRYGDRIALDWPGGYDDPGVTDAISGVAARFGLLLSDTGAPVSAGEVRPGTVRVVASRATASVPGCPDWNSTDIAPMNGTSSNYGCASNSNLAAMIADPNDLVVGRDGSTEGTGSTASRAIRVYREARPTGTQGLQQTTTTQSSGGGQ
jgi:pilus assembly protein CpaD